MGLKSFLTGFLLLGFLIAPISSFAFTGSDVNLTVVPETPEVNQDVTFMLSSFVTSLDNVTITWYVNGKNTLSGIGKKSFTVTAPGSGVEMKVTARISFADGAVEKNFSIRPDTVILLWEATDSYVPPFYKGKAWPSAQSGVKIVAMPEIRSGGVTVSPKSLIYNWTKDYSNEGEDSGYGKSSFTYVSDYLEQNNTIGVTAQTTGGQSSGTASLNVGTVSPEIVFYKKNADLGINWGNALLDGHLVKNSETIVAAPYFISPKDIRRPDLTLKWYLNDVLLTLTTVNKNLVPLTVEEGVSGSSNIRLEIENKYKIFQNPKNSINITY